MRTVLLLIFLKYSIIQCTPLPESRRLCKYKNVKIMSSKTESMTLDFSSTPVSLKTILKNECESWKRYNSQLKVRRSLAAVCYKIIEAAAVSVLADGVKKGIIYVAKKTVNSVNKVGNFIAKIVIQVPKVVEKIVIERGAKVGIPVKISKQVAKNIIRRSVSTVDDNIEKMGYLPEKGLSQFEEAVAEELEPLFAPLKYTSEETQKVVQNDFSSVVAHFLRNGNFDGLSLMLSEKYDMNLENIHQHKISDYHRINHDTVNCDSKIPSISFDLGIYSIEENSDVLKVEMCEDLGFASKETNNYYYHEFPEATFSNSSGTYQIDMESCAGDKILVCSSDAISPSDCSVDKTRKCNLRTKTQNEEIYRKLRVGAVVLGNFEHIISWKDDLATVYKVTPHKLHYISPGASQRIEFGKHQLIQETDREQNIIIEIR